MIPALFLCAVLLAGCYEFGNIYEQGCSALAEQVVYYESFDSYASGATAASIGLIENTFGIGSLDAKIEYTPSAVDRSLWFDDEDISGYLEVGVDLTAPMTGCVRIAFELRERPVGSEPTIVVADSVGSEAIRLRVTGSRDVQYDDDGFVTAGSLGGSMVSFYEFRIDADLSAGTYDLFLDGAQIVSSAPMVAPIDNVDLLTFRTSFGSEGETYIDDIRAAELRAQ